MKRPPKEKPFVPVVEDQPIPGGTLRWSVTAREYTVITNDRRTSPPFKNRPDALAWARENA